MDSYETCCHYTNISLVFNSCHISPILCAVLSFDNSCIIQTIRVTTDYIPLFSPLFQVFLLKLVSVLFPTSDLRHDVVTPAMLLLSQLLTQCPVRSIHDVTAAMLCANIALEVRYNIFSSRMGRVCNTMRVKSQHNILLVDKRAVIQK